MVEVLRHNDSEIPLGAALGKVVWGRGGSVVSLSLLYSALFFLDLP